jgi:mitogen-activated protein kinase kinase 4
LGITLYELATGKFPYPQWKSIFHQLDLVVGSDAPRLDSERLSHEFRDFVNTW